MSKAQEHLRVFLTPLLIQNNTTTNNFKMLRQSLKTHAGQACKEQPKTKMIKENSTVK